MMKSFKNLKFTVLIAFILEYFFNSYSLASFRNRGLENDTKRPVAHNYLGVIGETLQNL